MFYDFKPSKRKYTGTGASKDKLAERIAARGMHFQRRWAGFMGRMAGKLPGRWVKPVFVFAALTIGAYCTYLFASGLYGLDINELKQPVERVRRWTADGLSFQQKGQFILPDSLTAAPDSTSTP